MSDELTTTSSQVSDLVVPVRNTLVDVLRDPILNEDFGGKDGKLTRAQSGLAAAVVAKMQDRLMQQMERAHQRELNLIAGFWKLYRTPVFRKTWNRQKPGKPMTHHQNPRDSLSYSLGATSLVALQSLSALWRSTIPRLLRATKSTGGTPNQIQARSVFNSNPNRRQTKPSNTS
jgi:hypothetical protein